MRTHLVTYDLIRPGQSYALLHQAIKSAAGNNGWCHPVESFWLVNTDLSSEQLVTHLMRFIDKNDKLFVVDVGADWCSYGLAPPVIAWLRSSHRPMAA